MTNTAIITGASRGLGLALARALAGAGWNLVLTARGPHELERAADELGATAIPGDVTDPAHVRRLAEAAPELDLLVNNAGDLGATPLPPLAIYPLDTFRALLETNVTAPLALVQATLPALRASRGAIVNITSDAATGAYEGWGGYGATKAALDQLSNVLSAEEPDVRVWWADPGEMNTRMLADAVGAEEASAATDPAKVAAALHDLVASRPASGKVSLQ
ncbi:NAD(P)-dependent dehydrogenase (short-subunit alcohol dehydrogenase family) [Nonomuraea thailandensis]|uniref:NAD(P)-dependent dehydrogenase (Short-subunit alcohol dehydrogenase family) n=1 Tax=Nonomuraea thailandensis TaxID=1188745 RepID=A0A9X2GRR9_9ACTN|nr:SDR family NAD(P)-dependent oxidoreductase [Nonomuraea thailandensis]MCP2362820.1 NAD(P)-dependent dehydrogenase (short-subunit alcohol dehydrogenase family) [Nonomuraea thailandensis]